MKEESRIEALEHELKILKNEIQSHAFGNSRTNPQPLLS